MPDQSVNSAPEKPETNAASAPHGSQAGAGASGPAGRTPHNGPRQNYTQAYARNYSRNRRKTSSKNAYPIPWWIVVLAWLFATPLGIALLALNLVLGQREWLFSSLGHKFGPGSVHVPVFGTRPQDGNVVKWLSIAGGILTVVGGLTSMATLFDNLWILTDMGDIAWFMEEFWPGAMMLLGGLALCFAGHRVRTGWLLRRRIANIVGDADYMYLADIAASLGCSVDKCIDYLETGIRQGIFGPAAYLDMRSQALVVRGKAPQPQQAPAPKPEPAPEPKKEEPVAEENRYDKILQELRQVNDAIPDEEMSAKISRLEAVSGKIFAQIQDDPDKLPQLRKFMDYYLPTSLKLLHTYAELEAQGVEGTNIRESKHRIEKTMDTLVTAFENQLDKLFQDDALDVSTDIEVMEKMLSADGLVGDADPFGLHDHLSS